MVTAGVDFTGFPLTTSNNSYSFAVIDEKPTEEAWLRSPRWAGHQRPRFLPENRLGENWGPGGPTTLQAQDRKSCMPPGVHHIAYYSSALCCIHRNTQLLLSSFNTPLLIGCLSLLWFWCSFVSRKKITKQCCVAAKLDRIHCAGWSATRWIKDKRI